MSTASVYRDEYLQLFSPWNEETFWASGGVDDVEIDRAAARLGVTLPEGYRAFLTEFGAARLNHTTLFGLGVSDLRLNLVSRNLIEWPRPPRHLLFVAETLAENRFYLTTSDSTDDAACPVLVDLNEKGYRVFATTFLEFIQELCRGLSPAGGA